MKIVHVEDFLQPDAGYQVNILSKLQIKQGHEVSIVTSELQKSPEYLTSFFGKNNIEKRDKQFYIHTGVKIVRVPLIGFYSGRAIYYPRIFKIVDELKPDILFVHGEDTLIGIQFIVRSLWQKYPMILDCHMLEMASVNRFKKIFRFIYKHCITPIIIKKRIPLIRVVDSNYVEKCLGLPLSKTILLSLGTDTSLFLPNIDNYNTFRANNNFEKNDFVVIYAGKLDRHKGGKFFAESIKQRLVSKNGRSVKFIIIGGTVGAYGQQVEDILGKSENVILRLPTQPYYDLAHFYQAADLAVFPRQCSLSFFDVQACGLPVVMEENEINLQRVKNNNGFLFRAEDIASFRENILKMADIASTDYLSMREAARNYIKNNFDYIPIAERFTKVLVDKYNDFHAK